MRQKNIFVLWALLAVMSINAQGQYAVNQKDTVQIVAVGDIMMGTMYPDGAYLPKNNDCSGSFAHVKPYFANADMLFGNLEGALIRNTTGAKKCGDPKICYTFGMPAAFVSCLSDAGFNLLSIANNHSGDFGEVGRQTTKETLRGAGIHYAGQLDCPTAIVEKKGVKYGFCAFAPNKGTVDVNNIPAAEAIVRSLDSVCDIVIVSFHAGAEGSSYQHVTKKSETFVGENRGNVYEFAHRMIEAGGDVLLGHGPHVTRAIEVYKNRFITYSMGNFSTFSRVNVQGVSGLAPIIRIFTDKKGQFIKAQITPTCQSSDNRTPRYDHERRVIKVIQNLTKTDFPEVPIKISDDGEVLIQN
jgi:poly-gamma-glutamate capsule biosynthesis protein CapA/YwtB (metallophosphatase superfamily)